MNVFERKNSIEVFELDLLMCYDDKAPKVSYNDDKTAIFVEFEEHKAAKIFASQIKGNLLKFIKKNIRKYSDGKLRQGAFDFVPKEKDVCNSWVYLLNGVCNFKANKADEYGDTPSYLLTVHYKLVKNDKGGKNLQYTFSFKTWKGRDIPYKYDSVLYQSK